MVKIAELLGHGEQNARTGKELAAFYGCELRTITEQIERERRAGAPICATSNYKNPGYYLASNQQELRHYCNQLHQRAGELYKTRRALLNVLRQLPDKMGGADPGGMDPGGKDQ
jgi:hypothetical protein